MQQDKFEHFAIVELFGHQRMAGLVTEQTIGGCQFVRVDVPAVDGVSAYTRLLGQGAIYAINICDEATALVCARAWRFRPVSAYELPQLQQSIGYTEEDLQDTESWESLNDQR